MEEINIEFEQEITSDIDKAQISKVCIDYLLNYEEGNINSIGLENYKKDFIEMEFFNCVIAIERCQEVIKIIFK